MPPAPPVPLPPVPGATEPPVPAVPPPVPAVLPPVPAVALPPVPPVPAEVVPPAPPVARAGSGNMVSEVLFPHPPDTAATIIMGNAVAIAPLRHEPRLAIRMVRRVPRILNSGQ